MKQLIAAAAPASGTEGRNVSGWCDVGGRSGLGRSKGKTACSCQTGCTPDAADDRVQTGCRPDAAGTGCRRQEETHPPPDGPPPAGRRIPSRQ